ncbi:hypothetical protein F5883DRAFT_233830 [Diaporthe sp. PMI_573]|nr:hypothetical protein F5883DRAFT_233830 [Diaporthaceae sp. PMI_573]
MALASWGSCLLRNVSATCYERKGGVIRYGLVPASRSDWGSGVTSGESSSIRGDDVSSRPSPRSPQSNSPSLVISITLTSEGAGGPRWLSCASCRSVVWPLDEAIGGPSRRGQ